MRRLRLRGQGKFHALDVDPRRGLRSRLGPVPRRSQRIRNINHLHRSLSEDSQDRPRGLAKVPSDWHFTEARQQVLRDVHHFWREPVHPALDPHGRNFHPLHLPDRHGAARCFQVAGRRQRQKHAPIGRPGARPSLARSRAQQRSRERRLQIGPQYRGLSIAIRLGAGRTTGPRNQDGDGEGGAASVRVFQCLPNASASPRVGGVGPEVRSTWGANVRPSRSEGCEGFRDPQNLRAGEGIRTLDVQLGNVAL
jgi:hypothetical protein